MLNDRQIESAFKAIALRRRVGKMREQLGDPDFWRALNPGLAISNVPFSSGATPVPMAADEAARQTAFLMAEGYMQTPALFPPAEIAPLRLAVERIAGLGLPSGFALVYDDYYRLLARLEPVLEPMLGARPLLLPESFWIFHVDPGDPGRGGFGGYGPHRDYLIDRQFIDGGLPRVLTMWLPLTDVTPLDSCLYVVPAACDPEFYSERRDVLQDEVRLQDVRALPAPAGSLIAFSTRIAHWASASSPWARGPRIAIACFLQRRDVPLFWETAVDFDAPFAFEERLALIYESLGHTGLEDGRP